MYYLMNYMYHLNVNKLEKEKTLLYWNTLKRYLMLFKNLLGHCNQLDKQTNKNAEESKIN